MSRIVFAPVLIVYEDSQKYNQKFGMELFQGDLRRNFADKRVQDIRPQDIRAQDLRSQT